MSVNGNQTAVLGALLSSEFGGEFSADTSEFAQNSAATGSALLQGSSADNIGLLAAATGTATAPLSSLLQGYLQSLLPGGWFGWVAPVKNVVLGGLADTLAATGTLLRVVRDQTRISTSTGWLLDITAWDYFGLRFRRFSGELDTSFRARLVQEIVQERVTRAGVASALTRLTGKAPIIFEPFNAADCGGYRCPVLAYGRSGRYGSVSYPNQMFITAFRQPLASIPYVPGYGNPQGGYGRAPLSYASLSEVQGPVKDSDIIQCVKNNVAAGVVGWLRISSDQGAASVPLPFGLPILATDDLSQILTTDDGSAYLAGA